MSDFGMSDNELEQMYQEVILDAARNPHGREHFAQDLSREPGEATAANQGDTTLRANHAYCTPGESHQFNPTCGDEVTVHVEIGKDDPRRIERLVWDGQGCSISQASLSVMTDLVNGKTVDEAMRLFAIFHRLMQSRGAGLDNDEDDEALGDAVVFQGASKYPMRIKCALLGWEGLKDSLAKALAARA
ncbi:Fe-S cluster assembly sulfur transfer protein SufU [Bifidobacterium sp.]|jgi:nitrogen fixation NifU-like protein|uniref:Fe-S cluster assembly sulfur transfer protein SufU n=1 Tax=Bifidobacterium sp. TaxID=41200 RepID=UPI0025BCB0FE|nr:SUF system NifU family Fe-S cluster assembly protein [Bifidobacterium sp.]MCH4209847.1 SUF system NifU family Fe-S cluster assembly protein [Bifidobacterium sp.]MCI1224168.1 SUF system NifU family Fe-S cluster assembly protein [Bifidobacterium sp.]